MKYPVDADSALPNLALMRLSTYFRDRGEDVRLLKKPRRDLWDPPGEVYGSSIFKFSDKVRAAYERQWGGVRWGGTGVRNESSLDEIDASVDWESVPLDWSLYPEEKRSIGFTQRGCRLRCKFCVVPTKEGKNRAVKYADEICYSLGFQWWSDEYSYYPPDRLVPWHRLDWFAALDWFDAWRGARP